MKVVSRFIRVKNFGTNDAFNELLKNHWDPFYIPVFPPGMATRAGYQNHRHPYTHRIDGQVRRDRTATIPPTIEDEHDDTSYHIRTILTETDQKKRRIMDFPTLPPIPPTTPVPKPTQGHSRILSERSQDRIIRKLNTQQDSGGMAPTTQATIQSFQDMDMGGGQERSGVEERVQTQEYKYSNSNRFDTQGQEETTKENVPNEFPRTITSERRGKKETDQQRWQRETVETAPTYGEQEQGQRRHMSPLTMRNQWE